jgi:P22 coat protein - gene protein 5
MPNQLAPVIDKLLAAGLVALREQAIMPRLVNRAYEALAGQRGSTIDVPIPSAITATAVTPSNVPPTTPDIGPVSVAIPLDQWYEAPFYLTDKEQLEVMDGLIPLQATEAIKALANMVDKSILSQATKVYGMAGTPGTTPFQTDLTEYLDARKILNRQLAPMDNRAVVLDVEAEAKALNLRAFQDASFRGDTAGIINGQIGTKLGAVWVMDQNVMVHTTGTGTGYQTNGAQALGATTVLVDTGTGTLVPGDIITFASHTQTYAVQSATGGPPHTSITITPPLKLALLDNDVITKKATHVMNLNFHRDAFALASRPLESSDPFGLGRFQVAIDPVSGLALRFEVTREHKRTRFSYDILWGVQCVRPELAVIIAG